MPLLEFGNKKSKGMSYEIAWLSLKVDPEIQNLSQNKTNSSQNYTHITNKFCDKALSVLFLSFLHKSFIFIVEPQYQIG